MIEMTNVDSSGTNTGDGDSGESTQTIGAGFVALLGELAHLLKRFSETGEKGAVDLRSLPMAPGEYADLREALGQGEVSATLDLGSPSTIYETGFHGVWWVKHCTPDGETAAEYLEVSAIPEILLADAADASRDAQRLQTRVLQWSATDNRGRAADE